jgi:hypothetical protein
MTNPKPLGPLQNKSLPTGHVFLKQGCDRDATLAVRGLRREAVAGMLLKEPHFPRSKIATDKCVLGPSSWGCFCDGRVCRVFNSLAVILGFGGAFCLVIFAVQRRLLADFDSSNHTLFKSRRFLQIQKITSNLKEAFPSPAFASIFPARDAHHPTTLPSTSR